jgi:hypothetical protein
MKTSKYILSTMMMSFVFSTSHMFAAPLSQQKISQMMQTTKTQTAQLASVAIQPIFAEASTDNLATFKANVIKDMQNIRNDIKKLAGVLQMLSTNQQDILSTLQ